MKGILKPDMYMCPNRVGRAVPARRDNKSGLLSQRALAAELLFFKRTVHFNLLIGLYLLLTGSWVCLAEPVNINKEHWSFIPPKKSALPEVQQSDWIQNEIDVFTLSRMEKEGLQPSVKAGAATLIRRLSLDLTGLPPEPNRVRQFVNNPIPESYSRLVDQLLASPRFGEHFALPWLEIARYADTHGYQNDGERDMWRWRDWVVDALNRNLPYDQFTVEQLAGDLLPEPTLDQIVATGFNRNHRYNSEGGLIQAEFLVENVADRVDTTGTAWLGLTIGCARCHDHKYDPISQKDYYRFFAFFHNVPETGRAIRDGNSEPYIKAPTFLQQRVLAGMEERMQYRRARVQAMESRVAALQHDWENRLVQSPVEIPFMNESLVAHFPFNGSVSNAVKPEKDSDVSESADATGFVDGIFGQAVRLDGSGFIDAGKIGNFQNQTRYSISLWIRPESVSTGILLSRMNRTTERRGYQLMLREGKVVFISISRWIAGVIGVRTQLEVSPERFQHIAVTYDGSMSARGIQIYIGGKKQTVEILYNSDSNPGAIPDVPLQIGDGPFFGEAYQGAIDDLRLYQKKLSDEEIEILAVALRPSEIAQLNPAQRSRGAFRKLRQVFLKETDDEEIRKGFDDLYRAEKEKSEYLETLPTLMVMKEMPIPRKTYLLKRGQYDQYGERVEAGIPEYFTEMPSGLAMDRLGLARWLVNPENPLTARVAMNRLWQHLFGTGLVKTAEDFGVQGEPPSHPGLLDFLAVEFMHRGWNLKALIKKIVLSATYQQSSVIDPVLLEMDPENRLLARASRFRLSGHALRDQALSFAGLLSARFGGKPVNPYQPAGLWTEVSRKKYLLSEGDDLYRRSLYTYWKRTIAPPMMLSFDAADRESCRVRKTLTNTPLQALILLNDVTFLEAARHLAQRIIVEGGALIGDRVRCGFFRVLSRNPDQREAQTLIQSVKHSLEYFRSSPEKTASLLKQGQSSVLQDLDPSELAAYTVFASILFNLDETLTRI